MKSPRISPFVGALLAWAAATAPPAVALPVTITFSAQNYGSGMGGSNGLELPAESLVRFGYFTIPTEQVVAGVGTPSLLDASFIELAKTRIGYFEGSTVLDETGAILSHTESNSPYEEGPGLFGHSVTYDPEALDLLATRFFLWIVDSPELDTATEFGLFSDPAWLSPNTPGGDTVYDMSSVDPQNAQHVYHGDRGPEISALPGLGPLNKLRPISGIPAPEPHLPALLLLAAATLGWRRRRSHPLN
jgi:hypothetical protein